MHCLLPPLLARVLIAASLGASLAALAEAANAQVGAREASVAQSAAIENLRYEVTFDRATALRRRMRVSTTFDIAAGSGGTEPVLLSLPEWTPGAYELSGFARWVLGFGATADGGTKTLQWDKLDHDTWRIQPNGARTITVAFDYVADSLDNAMSWARADFLLFNGTNVFVYPEGRSLDFRAQVTVHTEPGWRVVTSMPRGTLPAYTAANYHDLVDMPFFVGRFDVDSMRISGTWVRYATYPVGSVSGAMRQQAWDQLTRVIPPEVAVFGEVPWDTYTVMQIADSSYAGASGLEHQSSHVDVVTPVAIGSEFQPSLYAHEIFHAWNVKRLRPAEMWPYVYDRPQPTPWLWVSEGITDYYADLAAVRGGVVDERGFYALTAAKISEVASVVPVALEDASVNTWIHPVDGTGYLYYPKGSLAGFLLDMMIRDASENRRSLDTVMRDLYQTVYKSGRGFIAQDWWSAVVRAAGGGDSLFTAFAAQYVDGREPLPWERVLPLAGLRLQRDSEPRLGVFTLQDSAGAIVVTQLEEGGAAALAGVRQGDHLVSVGEIAVNDARFAEKFRVKYGAAAEGAPLSIRVRRGTETVTLAGKLHFVPGDARIEPDAKAPAKAVRIRNGILRGTVDR